MSTGQSPADEASSWQRGPGPQSLLPSEIHVWRIRRPSADVRRTCRKLLLELLGRYAGLDPGQVRLRRGPFGKPELDPGTIQFNVSHSGGMGLVALAAERRVGVDVEEIRGDVRVDDLARDFLSAQERELLRGLQGDARTQAFYAAWTRREASIKARGSSITQAKPGAPDEGQWHLRDMPVGEGYAAALCCEGTPAGILFWEWESA